MLTGNKFSMPPGINLFHPKSNNSACWEFLRGMDYTDSQLTVMQDLINSVPLLVMCAEYKGVRFEVSDVEDLQAIISYEGDVVIFRGRLGKFIYDLCQGFKAGLSRV